jgi:murein DD-endopeptidase MepM/ murein hydrolase activator NlpD
MPLTRRQLRELRERERLAQSPLDVAEAADAARREAEFLDSAEATVVPSAVGTQDAAGERTAPQPETESAAPLTTAADMIVAAELSEPDLEPVVVADSDREIIAPAAADAPVAEDLVTDGLFTEDLHTDSVHSTEVPLPTRAQLRADARAAVRPTSRSAAAFRPRPTSTGPASTRPGSSPAPTSGKSNRARRIAAQGVSVAAMAFVALMAISTSLPAEALLSSADVQAAAVQETLGGDGHDHDIEGAQELSIARGTDTITVQRDGYESKSVAEVAAASGIRLEATFTNNPNGTVQWPFAVGVHIGDRFGYRNCAGCSSNHGGQDFNPGIGAPIQSIADGVVAYAQDGEGSLGVHLIIEHEINGEKVASVYAHMIHGSMLVKQGDVVKAGQVIGKTGNTGMSTGPHLHFEIRIGGKDGKKVDPLEWLYANVN